MIALTLVEVEGYYSLAHNLCKQRCLPQCSPKPKQPVRQRFINLPTWDSYSISTNKTRWLIHCNFI